MELEAIINIWETFRNFRELSETLETIWELEVIF
jgi:hypothetical protein